MDIVTAEGILREIFDADTKRYPTSVAQLHLNQACKLFSVKTDVFFDRYIKNHDYQIANEVSDDPNLVGSIPLSSLGYSARGLKFGWLKRAWWKNSAGVFTPLPVFSYGELLEEYGDTESATPLNIAIEGDQLYIRPIPTTALSLRMNVKGHAISITVGETPWLVNHPQAVIHLAAEWACTQLMESERIPEFRSMWQMELDEAGIDASMIGYDVPNIAEEPG